MGGRRLSLLQALYFCVHSSATVASMSWTCNLSSNPVENIPLPSEQESNPKESNHGGRRLRQRHAAIMVPGFRTNRRTRVDTLNDVGNHTSSDQIEGGRECTCAIILPTEAKFYCPLPSDHCSVWVRRYSQEQYGVSCFESKSWIVGFARSVWYYICFALFLLVLYPIFTNPGQHAVRYTLSRCFPKMNTWIAEQILRTEMEFRNRSRDESEHEARLSRRTEGWITGYSIKTKRHSHITSQPENGTESNNLNKSDQPFDQNDGNEANTADAPQDQNEVNSEAQMCTICLLAVEDGERIADLSCNHLYHAECLGEWILKKNSCPLCQDQDIAKEIRSFEPDDSGNNDESSGKDGILTRWRRQVRDTAREIFVDIATGRTRRTLNGNGVMLES